MITPQKIKELREITQAGMMDCKKALEASEGDIEKAIDWLRENGIAKAAKKGDRVTAEGLANVVSLNNDAVIVEINSETDFVAKNDNFVALVNTISNHLLQTKPKTLEEALNTKIDNMSLNDYISASTGKIGEKISLRRFEILTKQDNDSFGTYIHLGGKIAVAVIITNTQNVELARDIAMHIAALAPQYVSSNDVSEDAKVKERQYQVEVTKAEEKYANMPEDNFNKVIDGRVNKSINSLCLLEQPFVKEQKTTVGQLLSKQNSTVLKMIRFSVGEGIEKVVVDFAKEVAEQAARPK
jgi:elongation factor Ts